MADRLDGPVQIEDQEVTVQAVVGRQAVGRDRQGADAKRFQHGLARQLGLARDVGQAPLGRDVTFLSRADRIARLQIGLVVGQQCCQLGMGGGLGRLGRGLGQGRRSGRTKKSGGEAGEGETVHGAPIERGPHGD